MLDRSDFRISDSKSERKYRQGSEIGKYCKGYLMDDKYIILDEEDYEAASPEKSKILSIDQFVKESEVDSVWLKIRTISNRRKMVKATVVFC
jgi:DNA end-binding protein Ku